MTNPRINVILKTTRTLGNTKVFMIIYCYRPDSVGLEAYLAKMDRLLLAHNYFQKHNPTSLELADVVCYCFDFVSFFYFIMLVFINTFPVFNFLT